MIFKKIGISIVYFILGIIVNFLATMLGLGNANGGNGYTIPALLLVGIALCAISIYQREAKLRREHKGDESREKRVFNSSVKEKLHFIITTKDFKIETVIHIIFSIVLIIIPFIQSVSARGFSAVFSQTFNVIILIVGVIAFPLCMMGFNIISWFIAYNKCYKSKEF